MIPFAPMMLVASTVVATADAAPARTPEAEKARRDAYMQAARASIADRGRGLPFDWDRDASTFRRLYEDDPDDSYGYLSLEFLAIGDALAQGPMVDEVNPHFAWAMGEMTRRYARGPRVDQACRIFGWADYYGAKSELAGRFLREVLDHNPSPHLRRSAADGLIVRSEGRADLARRLARPGGEALARRLGAAWGRGYVEALRAVDPDALDAQAREVRALRAALPAEDAPEEGPAPGDLAPEIAGEDLEGAPMSLDAHRGKVVFLSFWGFGCAPCVAMHPTEKELVERMQGRPFALLGVSNDIGREKTRDRCRDEGINWRSWWDGEGTGNPITAAWKVRGWPTTYLIDHRGVIRRRGVQSPREIDLLVDLLVSDAEADAAPR